MPTTQPTTMTEAFQRTAAIDPDAVALRSPGDAQTLTWREYADQVRALAAGLAALGVRRGDTVALMMSNRVEFYPVDTAAQHLGATSFSVYNTLPADVLGYVMTNAGNRVVVCEEQYVDRIRASGAPIEHLVCVDGSPAGTLPLRDLAGLGDPDFDFEAAWRAVRPDDVLTLIYTSGTTGNPKGVELTHANALAETAAVDEIYGLRYGDRTVSFLPSAHAADRFVGLYFQSVFGTQVTAVADLKAIGAALPDAKPTIWGCVPRVWEKLKIGIEMAVQQEQDEARRKGLQWAMGVARRKASLDRAGEAVPPELAAEYAKADELVLSKLRAKVGLDQLRWAVSGAAPIPPETLEFFLGLGVPLAEIWGMSETTCLCSASPPNPTKLGAVGRIMPGMEARIAADGELLVRGPLVMRGYRGEPEKTAEALDADGWLHTGDIATIDDDSYLRIVDRKKELIINSAGKNMSPANIETAIKAASPLIGQVVTIGDARPFNTAVIVLDPDVAAAYAARRGLTDLSPAALAEDDVLTKEISAGVAAGNERLSRVEQIKRFRILPAFWEPGSDELTPTLKLKRRPIAAKYSAEIEELYASPPPPGVHEVRV